MIVKYYYFVIILVNQWSISKNSSTFDFTKNIFLMPFYFKAKCDNGLCLSKAIVELVYIFWKEFFAFPPSYMFNNLMYKNSQEVGCIQVSYLGKEISL